MRSGSQSSTSRRAVSVTSGTALTSLTSLLLTVAIARQTSAEEFSRFAVAIVVYVLVNGAVRAGFTESVLVTLGDRATWSRQLRRTSAVTLVAGATIVACGALTTNPYLALLGACLNALSVFDFLRTLDLTIGNARRGMNRTLAWSLPTLALSVVSVIQPVPPLALFATWCGTATVLGYVSLLRDHETWKPGWPRHAPETRENVLFVIDFAVGSGGSTATTLLLAPLLSPRAVGALRGAATLLGPVSLIATSARAVIIPFLVRSRATDAAADIPAALRASAVLGAITAPLLALVALVPDWLGTMLLGETFAASDVVLVPLAIESFFALLSGVPAAGHRSLLAGRRTILLRCAIGIPRPFAVCGAALAWGVAGAAWTMAAIAVINTIVWWISFVTLARPAPTPALRR